MKSAEALANRQWVLRLAIFLLFLAILNYGIWSLHVGAAYFIYANETLLSLMLPFGTCLLILITMACIGWSIIEDIFQTRRTTAFNLISMTLLVNAVVLMFFASLGIFTEKFTHRTSFHHDGQVYHLAARNTFDDGGSGRYVLFACDHFGIVCQSVFETDCCTFTDGSQASIFVERDTLAIHIDGWERDEIFYYPP